MIRTSMRIFSALAAAIILSSCGNGGDSTAQESYISGDGAITFVSQSERKPAPTLSGSTLYGTEFAFT